VSKKRVPEQGVFLALDSWAVEIRAGVRPR